MGELHIIMGPMFCGKSNQLLIEIEKYSFTDIPICVVNHTLDIRYGSIGISTHNGKTHEGYKVTDLAELFDLPKYKSSRVVFIDECNFYKNLRQHILTMVETDNKVIFAAGLNGTFDRKPFGEFFDIIPLANKITHLQSVCIDCKDNVTPGLFSQQLDIADGSIIINQLQNQSGDINIGGHQFQLIFSNTQGLFEKTYLTNTDGSWAKHIYFGFNLTRDFNRKTD